MDSYAAALAAWERRKQEIDAFSPKPHQEEYERAIRKWDLVLAWCRKNNDGSMAAAAVAKIEVLKRSLDSPRPKPLAKADTLDGFLDFTSRMPNWDRSLAEVTRMLETIDKEEHAPPSAAVDAITVQGAESVLLPNSGILPVDSIETERLIWNDRIDVLRETIAGRSDHSVRTHVGSFLETKLNSVSAGRYASLHQHLTAFSAWLGEETPVTDINGRTLSSYFVELQKSKHTHAPKDAFDSVRQFTRWLWNIEAIPTLPRNIDDVSLRFETPSPRIVTYTNEEIAALISAASQRTELYLLLMLNCGMTQKDIADLKQSEVLWAESRIVRKRSKTRRKKGVPTVSYQLWPRTSHLLSLERASTDSEFVLLNERGGPLWQAEVSTDGTIRKIDNIRTAFQRLTAKVKIRKTLKSLKKTSATRIKSNGRFRGLERLFLGLSKRDIAESHYAADPQAALDEAILWLGQQYGLIPMANPGSQCSASTASD